MSQAEYEKLVITLQTFKFERTLGKGGFGKVNAVIFTPTQRWFAMKTMKKITVLEKKGLAMLVSPVFHRLKGGGNPHMGERIVSNHSPLLYNYDHSIMSVISSWI